MKRIIIGLYYLPKDFFNSYGPNSADGEHYDRPSQRLDSQLRYSMLKRWFKFDTQQLCIRLFQQSCQPRTFKLRMTSDENHFFRYFDG
jgi:hypothetical protein